MELKEMIYKRKSVRKYKSEPVDKATLEKISKACSELIPLYPEIKVKAEIIGKENVRCILPWTTPQLIAVFSEVKIGYLENIGFMFQQMDLYLESLGLGSCWLGMGKLDSYEGDASADGLRFVIMLAFGYPKEELRSKPSQFRRKALSEISDSEDIRLEPARLAPSSVNSQPWYFIHKDGLIHTYCVRQGIFKNKALSKINKIDIGIALSHIYLTNPETFIFFVTDDAPSVKGYQYTGTVII